VFTGETGPPLNPSTDHHHWKRLLREAGIMAITVWPSASMAKRYQHVTDPMPHDLGRKIGGLLWGGPGPGSLAKALPEAQNRN
jgi:hypothetical protein